MAERNLSDEQIRERLMQAEKALQDADWEQARNLYQAVLDMDEKHQHAQQGLQTAQKMELAEKKVADLVALGDRAFDADEYRKAADRYTDAWNTAGQSGIIRHIAELEQKRSLALDLAGWGQRVAELTREQETPLPEQRKALREALQEVPREELFDELFGKPLRKALQDRESQMGDDEHIKAADEAYKAADFEQVVHQLQQVSSETATRQDVQSRLEKAQNFVGRLRKALEVPTGLLEQREYRGVQNALENVEAVYQRSPQWRSLRLQAGLGLARTALKAGRDANGAGEYDVAEREFETARREAGEVLKLFSDQEDASRYAAEADDLLNISRQEQDARQAWERGDLAKANELLGTALNRLARAREAKREYLSVQSDLERLKRRLDAELEAQERDPRLLKEAQGQVNKKAWREAEGIYRQLTLSPLEEMRKAGEQGLERVRKSMAEFESLLESAGKAANSPERVKLLEQAVGLWPSDSRPYGPLERTLLEMAEEAREDPRRRDEVVGYLTKVLKYNPNNERALELRESLDIRSKVNATIEQAGQQLATLEQAEEPLTLERLDEIVEPLKALQAEIGKKGELHNLLKGTLDQIQARQQLWKGYLKAYAVVEKQVDSGEWLLAAEGLGKALEGFGDALPAGQKAKLTTWQGYAAKLVEFQNELQPAWNELQGRYENILESRDYDGFRSAAEKVHHLVDDGKRGLPKIPARMADYTDRAAKLIEKLEVVQKLPAGEPQETLAALEQVDWKNDRLLTSLHDEALKRLETAIPELRTQIQNALKQNDLDKAQNALSQLGELQGKTVDKDVLNWRKELQTRQNVLVKIDASEKSIADWISKDQLTKAVDELQKALRLLNTAQANLLDSSVNLITKILEYKTDPESPSTLGKRENYEQADKYLSELRQLENQDGILKIAGELAERWLHLARRVALQGLVESGVALSTFAEAYRAASDLLKLEPGNKKYIDQMALVGNKLLNQLKESAKNRIDHAQAAFKRSDFVTVTTYLQELENTFFKVYEKEFPELLSLDNEIPSLRSQGQDLLVQVKEYENVQHQIAPQLDEIEQFFLAGELTPAEQKLQSIPKLEEMPASLQKRLDSLKSQIQQRIQEQERSKLRKNILEVGLKLSGVINADGVRSLYENMSELRLGSRLDEKDEVLSQFDNQLDKVKSAYDTFVQVENAEQQADQARTDGRSAEALSLLDKALSLAKNADIRARLETKRAMVSKDAERQNSLAQALDQGRKAVLAGSYTEARREFEQAQLAGAIDVLELIILADAGMQVEQAREPGDNLEKASVQLGKAVKKLEPLTLLDDARIKNQAERLLDEAKTLLEEYQDQQNWQVDIRSTIIETEQALENGNPQEAGEILTTKWKQIRQENKGGKIKLWQETGEIKALREQINVSTRLRNVYEEAEKRFAEGDLNRAAEDAKAALENAPKNDPYTEKLTSLKGRIERTTNGELILVEMQTQARAGNFEKSDELLLEAAKLGVPQERQKKEQSWLADLRLKAAQQQARANRFREAHKLLQDAQQGADSQQYEKVFAEIVRLEQSWKENVLKPIREQAKLWQYREAFTELERLNNQLAWPEFADDLGQEKKRLVDDWVKHDLAEIRGKLNQVRTIKDRQVVTERLDTLRKRQPVPNDELMGEIIQLIQEQKELVLKAEFGAAKELIEVERWDAAKEKLDSILKRTDELNLIELGWEVEQTLNELGTQQSSHTAKKEQNTRDKLLNDARQWYAQPGSKDDLFRVKKNLERILAMGAFKDDSESQHLLEIVEVDISLYDETQHVIDDAIANIGTSHFIDAERALSLARPSRLLETGYINLRKAVRHLSLAETNQNHANWKEALENLRLAGNVDIASLGVNLEEQTKLIIDKTRRGLGMSLFGDLDNILISPTGAVADASTALAQARQQDWLVSEHLTRAVEYERWIESRKAVDDVRAMFRKSKGDVNLATAEQLLERAQEYHPASKEREIVDSWLSILEAERAYQAGNHAEFLAQVSKVSDEILAQETWLGNRRKEIERSQADSGVSNRTQEEILEILQTNNFDRAVERVLSSIKELKTAAQRDRLKKWFEDELEKRHQVALETAQYEMNVRINQALSKLFPEKTEYGRRVHEIGTQVSGKHNSYVYQVREHLDGFDPVNARTPLELARSLLIQSPNSTRQKELDKLEQQIDQLSQNISEMNDALQAMNQVAAANEWLVAIERLRQAEKVLSIHPSVKNARTTLQSRLYDSAQDYYKNRDDLVKANKLCQLGLDLGKSSELSALKREIEREQSVRMDALKQKISRALTSWDLTSAQELFNQVERLDAGGNRRKELESLIEEMRSQVNKISMDMDSAWSILDLRVSGDRYKQAAKIFEHILDYAPSFGEAALWQSYATRMDKAITHIQEDSFSQGMLSFGEAESVLLPREDVPLVSVLLNGSKDALLAKRCVAAFEANQLCSHAKQLDTVYRIYESENQINNTEVALNALDDAIRLQEKILAMVGMPKYPTPPEDYWAKFGSAYNSLPEPNEKDKAVHKSRHPNDAADENEAGANENNHEENSDHTQEGDSVSSESTYQNHDELGGWTVNNSSPNPVEMAELSSSEVENESEPAAEIVKPQVHAKKPDFESDDVVENSQKIPDSSIQVIQTEVPKADIALPIKPIQDDQPEKSQESEDTTSSVKLDDIMDISKYFPSGDDDDES